MRFKIICVSSMINLMFRHYMRQYILKVNMQWYEKQAVAACGAIRRLGTIQPVKICPGVVVQIVGVVS